MLTAAYAETGAARLLRAAAELAPGRPGQDKSGSAGAHCVLLEDNPDPKSIRSLGLVDADDDKKAAREECLCILMLDLSAKQAVIRAKWHQCAFYRDLLTRDRMRFFTLQRC